MKRIYQIFLIALASLFTLTSCDDPTYPVNSSDEGQLLTKSLIVDVLNSEEVVARTAVDVSTFTVNIKNKKTGVIDFTWKYGVMPEIITIPVGEYTVEVFNKEVVDAEWESPYYYASKDVAIVKGEIAQIGTLTCKLANVKVSIKFTDELVALIGTGEDVNVNVKVGDRGTLDFKNGEIRAGFFRFVPESTTLVATFTGTVDGFYMNEFKVFSDIAAGQHRIITFGIKEGPTPPQEYGSIGTTGLGMDASVTVVDLTVDVPVEEEEIEPDDMLQVSSSNLSFNAKSGSKSMTVKATADWTVVSNSEWCTTSVPSGAKGETAVTVSVTENATAEARVAKLTFTMGNITREVIVNQAVKGDDTAPTITSESLDLEGVNLIVPGMTAAVTVNAPKTISHLIVEIVSPTLTPSDLQDVGLNSKFDLAEPGELETALNNLKFPTGKNVIGQTQLEINISDFMGLLNGFKSEHQFVITVEDANGQKVISTLKFLAQ